MKLLTYLTVDGNTYVSTRPSAPSDLAVPDRPGPEHVFDREAWVWELRSPEPEKPTLEELQQQFIVAIDSHMNVFAATRGYDSMASAASYAGDEADPVFAVEGAYAKRMRSLIYRQAYGLLDAVLSGERPSPTVEEVLDELPPLQWPNVAGTAR